MRNLRFQSRYFRVLRFFSGVFLSVFWWDIFLRRVGLRTLVRRTRRRRYAESARQFRILATQMGGLWIKVGQFLSARVDVLPETITRELANLQDEVLPEPFEVVQRMIQTEFEQPVAHLFEGLNPVPLASASLGQVHRARLSDGTPVVVKVQRPYIDDVIRVDLRALGTVIQWLKRYKAISRRADLDSLLEEFSKTLWEELDYIHEGENARRFGEMYTEDPRIHVPIVYKEYTTKRVLTLEDVYFIKITNYEAIEAAGIPRSEVALRLFNTYLRQIFEEGFFHADPHPGNLFVEPLPISTSTTTPAWRLVFVDFGMTGTLPPGLREGLQEIAIAVATRDASRLVRSYERLGVLLPGADTSRLEQLEAAMFDRFWGKSMKELTRIRPWEMREFGHEFRDLMFELPFQVPTNLIYFGRCVAILSGMCTGLDREFNLFENLAPFARQMVAGEEGEWMDTIIEWLKDQGELLLAMPGRVDKVLTKLEEGKLEVVSQPSPRLDRIITSLTRAIRQLAGMVTFIGLLLTAVLFYLNEEPILAAIGFGLALLAFGWALLRGR